ncbi:MAG: BmrU protein [Oscillospiraceae bacterium]|nr:BmrU protein [Oscillospiraceae bacterium]
MRHIFIINPAAGKRNCTAEIMAMAKRLTARGLKTECILTKSPGHAQETAAAAAAAGGPVRFYACGGDGTVNEVANGIAGQDCAAMTCIPVGTGNDFLKNFGDAAPLFASAENLFDGPQFPLDAIDCNGRLALTVACAGLDAQVAEDVHRYGGLLKGQGSYIASLAVNFFSRSYSHRWTVALDGERASGDYILAAVCNGRYYGGGFMPSAEARMDDGVLHTVLVRRVDRLTFLRLVGDYAKGCAYRYPEVVRRSTAREVVIESRDGEIVICLDGETVHSRRVALRLSEKRVNFFGPEGCDPNATCRAPEDIN